MLILSNGLAVVTLMGDEEQGFVTEFSRPKHSPAPIQRTVVDLFRMQCNQQPQAIACEHAGETRTYEQLDRRSDQIADYLQSRAIGAKSIVGICMSRSIAVIEAVMGVLKSGAAYVPIEPTLPRQRLDHILADTSCSLVLTQRRFANRIQRDGIDLIDMNEQPAMTESLHATAMVERLHFARSRRHCVRHLHIWYDRLPKGVIVDHRALAHYAGWAKRVYTSDDVKTSRCSRRLGLTSLSRHCSFP